MNFAEHFPIQKRKRREVIDLCRSWKESLHRGDSWCLEETPGFGFHKEFLAKYRVWQTKRYMKEVHQEVARMAKDLGCSSAVLARLEIIEDTLRGIIEAHEDGV